MKPVTLSDTDFQNSLDAIAGILTALDRPHAWRTAVNPDHWIRFSLVSDDHLEIHAAQSDGRLKFSVTYGHELSKHIARYADARRNEEAPRITCSPSKTAAQLAADIYRRMIPDARCLRTKLLQRHHAEIGRREENHDRALRLVEAARGYFEMHTRQDPYGNEYDIPINLRAPGHCYFSGRLSPYGGGSFHITNSTIPYDLLLRLAPVIADYLDTVQST